MHNHSIDVEDVDNDCSMKSEMEIYNILLEAEEDVVHGNVSLMQDTFDEIRHELKKRKLK